MSGTPTIHTVVDKSSVNSVVKGALGLSEDRPALCSGLLLAAYGAMHNEFPPDPAGFLRDATEWLTLHSPTLTEEIHQ